MNSCSNFHLLQQWRWVPATTKKFFARPINFHLRKGRVSLVSVQMGCAAPALCFCRELQSGTGQVIPNSFKPRSSTGQELRVLESRLQEESCKTHEKTGAFQKLPMVMTSTDILASAKRKARNVPPTKGILNIAKRERNKGAKQLDALMKELVVPLRRYIESFPNKRSLHPYERSLIELTLGEGSYEEVLGRVNSLRKKILFAGKQHASLCAQTMTKREAEERLSEGVTKLGELFEKDGKAVDDLVCVAKLCLNLHSQMIQPEKFWNVVRKAAKGKIIIPRRCLHDSGFFVLSCNSGGGSLLITQTTDSEITSMARALRAMPVVDPEKPTICLVGAPNVGKSSLVRVLSTGKPEVCHYPFTTRGILMGHISVNYENFQVTDTPGLLTRKDDDRNNMEKLTLAVLCHLPTAVLFVHDLTGECGTSPSNQFITYKEMKERFKDHLWIDVVSKCDLLEESKRSDPKDELGNYKSFGPDGALHVSVKTGRGVDEVKARVHDLLISQMARIRSDVVEVG